MPYDPTLFAGTAWHYARYRPDYPPALFSHLAAMYQLDRRARVLDLGCGTGQIAAGLAPHCGRVVGMEPDPEMLGEAGRLIEAAGLGNIELVRGSSWDLTPASGPFRLVAMGDAFHWMDRDAVLALLHTIIDPGGGVALVARSYQAPPGYQAVIDEVVEAFLGAQRRAGQGQYAHPAERHEVVLARSPFTVLEPWTGGYERPWAISDAIGYLYSTSYAARRLFGDQAERFEATVRERLLLLEPAGVFALRVEVTALLARKHPAA